MLQEIKKKDPDSFEKYAKIAAQFRPRLVMNMIEKPKDAEVALKIRRSCTEYLGIDVEHLGVIYRDSLQDTALASRLPIIVYKPQSILSQAIYRIADKILQSPEGHFDLDDKDLDTRFNEAALEAEIDFESKAEYVADLMHSGVMDQSDLMETVQAQQLEINKLKTENNFLKFKLSKAMEQGFKA
jgi:flagellar biosynthesis protein FlhG